MIKKCPLCKNSKLNLAIRMDNMPVLQNVDCLTKNKARSVPCGTINYYNCTVCDFTFNATYRQIDYDSSYENSQISSASFYDYFKLRARRVADYVNKLSGSCLIIEIGCGQGNFLRQIFSQLKKEAYGIGFDPACKNECIQTKNGSIRLIPEYYGGGGGG